jgi:aspartate carbamoyltransferase regulatory subunit
MGKSEKRQRFEKVASNRVQRILDTLSLLQNCSNRNNYEYDEKDVDLMFAEITKKLKETKSAYCNEIYKSDKQGFSF